MENTLNKISDDINLIKRGRVVEINPAFNKDIDDESEVLDFLNSLPMDNNYLLIYRHEVISDIQFYYNLIKFIGNRNIKIVQSTSNFTLKNNSHPFVHIFTWKDFYIKEHNFYGGSNNSSVKIFDDALLNNSSFIKNNSSILSTCRKTPIRDLIISNLETDKIGIFRYLEDDDNKKVYNGISWSKLVDEYKRSYISFILETNNSTDDIVPRLTEKTILAFLTKTVPIIFGQRGLISDLESMGFWIANRELGFEGDYLNNFDTNRVKSYSNIVNNISNMEYHRIIEFYKSNILKIENNYNIIQSILTRKHTSLI